MRKSFPRPEVATPRKHTEVKNTDNLSEILDTLRTIEDRKWIYLYTTRRQYNTANKKALESDEIRHRIPPEDN